MSALRATAVVLALLFAASPAVAATHKAKTTKSKTTKRAPTKTKPKKKRPTAPPPVEGIPVEDIPDFDPTPDVVEQIVIPESPATGTQSSQPVPPEPALAPTASVSPPLVIANTQPISESAAQVTGWARSTGMFYRPSTAALEASPYRTPYERAVSKTQLYVRGRGTQGKRFEAVVSGLLDFDASAFEGGDQRAQFEATLREAYAGLFLGPLDIRVGQQRIVWGRGDAFTPNDVINPRDHRDPVLAEPGMIHLPTPAVRLDIGNGTVGLQLVAVPFYTPDRVDVYGRNWALIQPSAPPWVRGVAGLSTQPGFENLNSTIVPLAGQNQSAGGEVSFSQPSAGAKANLDLRGIEFSTYYHYGYTSFPEVQVAPGVAESLSAVDFTQVDNPATFAAAFGAAAPVTSRAIERHHVGLDAQTTLGPIALRADAAYQSNQVFFRRDLTSVARPTAIGVLALEHDSDLGRVILLEAQYQRVFNSPPRDQMLGTFDKNFALAGQIQWTFFQSSPVQLELELRGTVGLLPQSYLVRPQVALKSGGFSLRVGTVLLDGEEGSLARYYQRNNQAYATAHFKF